jgi:hypothetical protein
MYNQFICCVWFLQETAIISLQNVHRFVFLRVAHCFLWGTNSEYFYIMWIHFSLQGPCHDSGGYSPAFHRRGPDSVPGQSMWDLWWTKWQWEKLFSEYFGAFCQLPYIQCSLFILILINLFPEGICDEGDITVSIYQLILNYNRIKVAVEIICVTTFQLLQHR